MYYFDADKNATSGLKTMRRKEHINLIAAKDKGLLLKGLAGCRVSEEVPWPDESLHPVR